MVVGMSMSVNVKMLWTNTRERENLTWCNVIRTIIDLSFAIIFSRSVIFSLDALSIPLNGSSRSSTLDSWKRAVAIEIIRRCPPLNSLSGTLLKGSRETMVSPFSLVSVFTGKNGLTRSRIKSSLSLQVPYTRAVVLRYSFGVIFFIPKSCWRIYVQDIRLKSVPFLYWTCRLDRSWRLNESQDNVFMDAYKKTDAFDNLPQNPKEAWLSWSWLS